MYLWLIDYIIFDGHGICEQKSINVATKYDSFAAAEEEVYNSIRPEKEVIITRITRHGRVESSTLVAVESSP